MKTRVCIDRPCQRTPLPDWSRCEAHRRLLIERLFGSRGRAA